MGGQGEGGVPVAKPHGHLVNILPLHQHRQGPGDPGVPGNRQTVLGEVDKKKKSTGNILQWWMGEGGSSKLSKMYHFIFKKTVGVRS